MPPSLLLLLLATAAALNAPTSRRWTWAHSGGGPVDIHYTACGPADARSCVVFAPGFTTLLRAALDEVRLRVRVQASD